jgi:RimJ/RimL family protein N-acetyltransferase
MKKLGFKQDGRLRQHHEVEGKLYDDLLFSILAEEAKL